MNQRVLAVDPGEKRLGVAISDLSGTIANPLSVVKTCFTASGCGMDCAACSGAIRIVNRRRPTTG